MVLDWANQRGLLAAQHRFVAESADLPSGRGFGRPRQHAISTQTRLTAIGRVRRGVIAYLAFDVHQLIMLRGE